MLRRVLHGDDIPRISTVVDAYNLASLQTIIALSGFDLDQISLPLNLRFSKEGEAFHGIGVNEQITVTNKTLVLSDTKRIVCIYPHRDADETKIAEKTKTVAIVGYGAPNISQDQLMEAVKTALNLIKQTSGGAIGTATAFKPLQTLY